MAQRTAVKTTYAVERTLQPIYSGGSVSLSEDGRIFAACLGEDVLLTDLTNGKELGRTEGVRPCHDLAVSCLLIGNTGWRASNSLDVLVACIFCTIPATNVHSNPVRLPSDRVLAIHVNAHILNSAERD